MNDSDIIPSGYYFSDDVYNNEFNRVYKQSWIFAGLMSELRNDRDYVTFDLFGLSLVVQNFRGELKCFQNVCSHRFNKLQHSAFGNRPLICNYHFWGYDKNGYPKTIPRKQAFSLSPEDIECLKLKQFKVDNCGEFVFVNLNNDANTLSEYLGAIEEQLLYISGCLGNRFYWEDVPHKANWKLLVENVLECYHCPSVHAESFFVMGYGQRSPENINFYSAHSVCDFPKTETKISERRNKVLAYLDERELKHASYRHYFVFPNLVFSSTEGVTFYIGQLLPQTSRETVLRIRNFDTKLDEKYQLSAIHNELKKSAISVLTTVINEDKTVIENVQKGIEQTHLFPLFGNEEVRILAFHKEYLNLLADK